MDIYECLPVFLNPALPSQSPLDTVSGIKMSNVFNTHTHTQTHTRTHTHKETYSYQYHHHVIVKTHKILSFACSQTHTHTFTQIGRVYISATSALHHYQSHS